MSTAKKLLLILALATGFALLAAGTAFAAGTVIPHGGYDTSSDACLQCHDVHEAASDYVLLRWETVVDTCGSCHYLYTGQYPKDMSDPDNQGSGGSGTYASTTATPGTITAYNPGYFGDETRTVTATSNSLGSRTSAYEVAYSTRDSQPGHTLQRGGGTYKHGDGTVANGAYIPGGEGGLTAIARAMGPGNTVGALEFAGTNGLFCASCHTPHGNFGQQLLNSTSQTVSSKILSGKPNHRATAISINDWATQGGTWCEGCHAKRKPEYQDAAGNVYHNHPDQFCLNCHGNAVPAGGNTDFPHTGTNDNLLSQVPDALCIDCHKKEMLP